MLAVDSHASGVCSAGTNGLPSNGAEPNEGFMSMPSAEPLLERSSHQSTHPVVLGVAFGPCVPKRSAVRRLADCERLLVLNELLRTRCAAASAATAAAAIASPAERAPEWLRRRVRDLDRVLDRDPALSCCTILADRLACRRFMMELGRLCEPVRDDVDAESQLSTLASMGRVPASLAPSP